MTAWRWLRWALLGLALTAVAAGIGALVLVRTEWFRQKAGDRIEREIALAFGARAEIGNLRVDWRRWTVSAGPVVVRGSEAATEQPLASLDSVEIGLRVQSFFARRVDVQSIVVRSPRIHVIVNSDGSTNIPGRGGDRSPARLIEAAIGHLELRNGEATVGLRTVRLNGVLRNVDAKVDFDAAAHAYRGELSAGQILAANREGSLSAAFMLARNELAVTRLAASFDGAKFDGTANVRDWQNPRSELTGRFLVDAVRGGRWIGLRDIGAGSVSGDVKAVAGDGAWSAEGRAAARNLTVTIAGETVRQAAADFRFTHAKGATSTRDAVARFWGGEFRGSASVTDSGSYEVSGDVSGIVAPRAVATSASGRVDLAGERTDLRRFAAQLTLSPRAGEVPVGGNLDISYDRGHRSLRIDRSALQLRDSHVALTGRVETGMEIDITTGDLAELLPALHLVSPDSPASIPVAIERGPLTFRGRVTGGVNAPVIDGTVAVAQARYEGRSWSGVRADFRATSGGLVIRRFASDQANASGQVALSRWRIVDASTLDLQTSVRAFDITSLDKDLHGYASGTAAVGGTLARPEVRGAVRIDQARWRGLQADRVDARGSFDSDLLTIEHASLERGASRVTLAGDWRRSSGDGSLAARVLRWDVPLPAEALAATGDVKGRFRANEKDGTFALLALDGEMRASSKRWGDLSARARTEGGELRMTGEAALMGSRVDLTSRWSLAGNMRGGGTATLRNLSPDLLRRLTTGDSESLPFIGQIEGRAEFSGYLLAPERLAARATLTTVRIAPRDQSLIGGASTADLTIRNDGDVVLDGGLSGVVIEQARFAARDTGLEARGNVTFHSSNAWNLLLRGRVSMAVLSTFYPNLIAAGTSTLDTRIRGVLDNPRVDGRMTFADASMYLRDVPNGLDKVNGTIVFNRSRATIEKLTGESGGGPVQLSGFVGYGAQPSATDPETAAGGMLTYQLAAKLDRVRVRYPEGFSTLVNAALTLTGTSKRNLLAGTVTVLRAAVTPGPSGAGLIASPRAPAVPDSDFLRNQQFDVKVETAQSAEFATELTRDVLADADIRLRGTPARPILLGRVSLTQGRVQFFGTDYRVNRGEITFQNPVMIDPIVDLDLETTVRGIVVSITFAGPLRKMSMSYRSDPPLQSSEILALLAVGRTPSSVPGVGVGTIRGNDLLTQSGGSAVINSAIAAAPTSGRLQRFFGVSRLKIDPQLIGIDNTPQARLSVEQQLSRNVSLSYVTSLSRAQQQIVRVQWDLTRQWSAIATRDENGVLSIDFVFRRSFR